MAKYDDSEGVWRTIGGRRVFIRKGQSLSDAMKESGKFKKKEEKDIEKTPGQKTADLIKENNIKTFADEIKEKNEKESISHLFDVKETEDGYEGKGKELLKFIENEEQDSGVEISDALKDKLRKNPDDTFVFDNENETIVAKTKNNPIQDMANERIAEKQNTLNNDKILLDGMKKKGLDEINGTTQKDLENRISKNEDYLKTAKGQTNKDGKYFRNRLQELDSADTPTGTYDIETGEAVDFKGKGYNVSFEQTGVQLSDDEYLAKINECRDRCDGKVYFGKYGGTPEVSFYTEDINEAMKIMKENNQYSIYDIANDTEIVNDEYNEATNKIKDLSQTKAIDDDIGNQIKQSIHNANLGEETKKLKDRKITTSQLEDYKKEYDKVQKQIDKNWEIISEESSKKISGGSYNAEKLEKARKEFDDLGARKNELGSIINQHTIDDNESKTMNDLIRTKASKKSAKQLDDELREKENKYLSSYKPSDKQQKDIKKMHDQLEKQAKEEGYDTSKTNWRDDIKDNSKTTNETMNKAIKEKASKKSSFKDDLPKKIEIKTQGTSNRKEVSENIQAHILDYYDSPQDFLDQMDAMSYLPTKWKQGEELAKGGSYLIYNGDMSDFLNELKINPKGKSFSDDKAFDMYTSLIGRESAKLYDKLMKNEYNKYKQSHPLTKMTLEEFIKSRKEK